jgi:hypothetical protein
VLYLSIDQAGTIPSEFNHTEPGLEEHEIHVSKPPGAVACFGMRKAVKVSPLSGVLSHSGRPRSIIEQRTDQGAR